jgi:hypothetical protein
MSDIIKNYGITGVSANLELGRRGVQIVGSDTEQIQILNANLELTPAVIAAGVNVSDAVTLSQLEATTSQKLQSVSAVVSYTDTQVSLGFAQSNTRIHWSVVDPVTEWTGASADTNISVGDSQDNSRLFTELDLLESIQSTDQRDHVYTDETEISVFLNAGPATAGSAKVTVWYTGTIRSEQGTPVSPGGSGNVVLDLDAADYSGSGDWLDGSGNQNHATLVATPTYVGTDQLYFDLDGGATTGPGSNDAFSVPDSATLDSMTSISFEIWFNIDTVQTGPNILFGKRSSNSNGFVGFFGSDGYTFRVGTGSNNQLTYATTPSTDVWQHLVVCVSSTGSQIYLNNTQVSDTAYTGDFGNIDTGTALSIGDLSISATGVFALNGKLALFRVYNTALTSGQVQTRWDQTKTRFGY